MAQLQLRLKFLDLGLQLFLQAVRDDVDRRRGETELTGDAEDGPALAVAEFEGLKVARGCVAREAGQRGLEHVVPPFVFPSGGFGGARGIGDAFDGGGVFLTGVGRAARGGEQTGGALAFAKFIRDAPAREVHQPPAKRAARRVRLELVDRFGDPLENILGDVFRLGAGEAGALGEAEDELLVEPVKLGPTHGVLPIAQAEEQTGPRSGGVGGFGGVDGHDHLPDETKVAGAILQQTCGAREIFSQKTERSGPLAAFRALPPTHSSSASHPPMPTSDRCRHPAFRTTDSGAAADFLALVCHELRTPLQTILGQSELLLRDATDEVARARLAAIAQHGALMLRLVNDLLDWRASGHEAFRLQPRALNLTALVAQTVESCRPAAATKGLGLRCEIAADAPSWVRLDGDRVRQVLLNLLGNAIKFTARGEVVVELAGQRGDGTVELGVKDSGPGIAAADRKKIFQPFARLEPTAAMEGAGLGLALSARLCERLGGALGVESDGHTGSVFRARFAARRCPPASIPPTPPPAQASFRGKRLLIADDNPLVRELFVAHLSRSGAQCECVTDGEQALSRALSGEFGTVVMDLSMPRLDGFEVTRQLRAQRGAALRIVGVSAHAGPTEHARALAVGMDLFLAKPVELGALTRALELPGPVGESAATQELRSALNAQFRREAQLQRATLETARQRQDWAGLEAQAHYVHNSACVVGDDTLGAACAALKQAAADRDGGAVARAWARCEAALARWFEPLEIRSAGQ